MSDETIFDSDDQQNKETPGAVVIPDNVKDLIGPGKKYPTLEKALESIYHAQNHISTLEGELKTLRENANGTVSQEEVLKTVQELLAEERKTHGTSQLDENVLDDILDRKLTAREEKIRQDQNVAAIKQQMKDTFGDKAEEVYKAKAAELGVGVSFLNSVVAKSPEAAQKLLGLEPKKTTGVAKTHGSVNSAALQFREQTPPERKKIMMGATTTDIVAEWRRHDPTKKE